MKKNRKLIFNIILVVFLMFLSSFLVVRKTYSVLSSSVRCETGSSCAYLGLCDSDMCNTCVSGEICCTDCIPSATVVQPEPTSACPCSFTNTYSGNEFGPITVPCGSSQLAGVCGGNGWSKDCALTEKINLMCDSKGGMDVGCATAEECVDDGQPNPTTPANPPGATATPIPSSSTIRCNLIGSGMTQTGAYPVKAYEITAGQNYSNALALSGQKDGSSASLNLKIWRAPFNTQCWYGKGYSPIPAGCPANINTENAFSKREQNTSYTLLTDFKTSDTANVPPGSYNIVCNASDPANSALVCSSNPSMAPNGSSGYQYCGDGGRVVIHVLGPPKQSECPETNVKGDANCDKNTDEADYAIWLDEFMSKKGIRSSFDQNERVDLIDYEIFRKNRQDDQSGSQTLPMPTGTDTRDDVVISPSQIVNPTEPRSGPSPVYTVPSPTNQLWPTEPKAHPTASLD